MARSTLAGLIFTVGTLAAQSPQLKQAGVCSRCHVAQVLEWSVAAKHVAASTTCQACHGPSAPHVANERNQVKPDFPSPSCQTCHSSGCPKTKQTANCAGCHHPHAVSNPNDRQLRQASETVDPAAATYAAQMREGERLVALRSWPQALAAFSAALSARPNDRRAAARRLMVERRISPALPGLEIVGNDFDPASGLPLLVRIPLLGLDLRLVPAGESDIGSDAWPASQPVHSVYTEPFYLGLYEVTQRQWSALGVENPSTVKGDSLPVHNVSWQDAAAWIAKLNERTGGRFRLPTEAEWERAAQPATSPLLDRAWYRANSAIAPAAPFRESNAYAPRPVGSKLPNPLGFFDMQGNIAEWCSSLFRPYPWTPAADRESLSAPGLRSVRGGAFADGPDLLHPAFRHSERPARRSPWIGFRLAR